MQNKEEKKMTKENKLNSKGKPHILKEVNVMKSTILELSSTTRESEIFTGNLNPILMSLD